MPPAYEQAIQNQPGVWQASACRLWSASGLIRVRVGRRLEGLRSRFSASAEV